MKAKKKLKLKLVGRDGNAFALLGYFKEQARKANWSREDIDEVMKEAMSGDYYNLLNVLSRV